MRLGSHPDDYALDFFGERPAFLVTDPHTAGVYDTIYVDLNDDYDFGDEKPVTKESPRSWRDLDGDGYVDLSGGMAYYISDGTGADGTPGAWRPRGLRARGQRRAGRDRRLDRRLRPGHRRPRHAVRQQHRRAGRHQRGLPTFTDIPGGKFPAAVVGGAPDATMVPSVTSTSASASPPSSPTCSRTSTASMSRRTPTGTATSTTTAWTRRARRPTSGTPRSAAAPRRCSRPGTARPASAL